MGVLFVFWFSTKMGVLFVLRLHFELRGSYFKVENSADRAGIQRAFKSEIRTSSEPYMINIRELLEKDSGGFDTAFDKFIRIEVYPDIIPPFSG
jgi:hypothetical protein